MNPLARLQARIVELEQARRDAESTLAAMERAPPPPQGTDWESRLSAARAVDALLGSDTASAVEAQRQADLQAREKQARKAAGEALKATQTREAMVALSRDLEAATALWERSVSDAARDRLASAETRYHSTRAAAMEAATNLAGWLSLCGRETEAHQLMRSIGTTGDTMTVIGQRANALRQHLLDEVENDHA